MVYSIFEKKTCGGAVENENMSNQELAEELHKLSIKQFEKRKVHSSSIDNIWVADLADMQLISKSNKRIRFFMCYVYL